MLPETNSMIDTMYWHAPPKKMRTDIMTLGICTPRACTPKPDIRNIPTFKMVVLDDMYGFRALLPYLLQRTRDLMAKGWQAFDGRLEVMADCDLRHGHQRYTYALVYFGR